MKKNVSIIILVCLVGFGIVMFLGDSNQGENEEIFEEKFKSEYVVESETKSDTFIFEGITQNGIITQLNFDVIRNQGTEDEYSKKDIMGYMMNVSDATISETENGFSLSNFTSFGYDPAYDEENGQFMVFASIDELDEETKFKELTIHDYAQNEIPMSSALISYSYVAKEVGIELTEDTLVKDLLVGHGLVGDGFKEGTNRISFAGYRGGRSYGEQLDAIVEYILDNEMTLEEVYELFKTENQSDKPIEERDTISGATIAFVSDFQRMVYSAIHGELFEGVIHQEEVDNGVRINVSTQGYGGEIVTQITYGEDGKINLIQILKENETDGIGKELVKEDSSFIQNIIENINSTESVDVVSGATMTSNALINAVALSQETYNNMK